MTTTGQPIDPRIEDFLDRLSHTRPPIDLPQSPQDDPVGALLTAFDDCLTLIQELAEQP